MFNLLTGGISKGNSRHFHNKSLSYWLGVFVNMNNHVFLKKASTLVCRFHKSMKVAYLENSLYFEPANAKNRKLKETRQKSKSLFSDCCDSQGLFDMSASGKKCMWVKYNFFKLFAHIVFSCLVHKHFKKHFFLN